MHPIRAQPKPQVNISQNKKTFTDNKKRTSWEFYDPPENFPPVEFCLDTSLHGLKYTGQPERHVFERIFWVVAFTAAVSAAGYLIYTMWVGFFETPIMTVFAAKETTLEEIPFPSVTICNVNNINRSKRRGYVIEANKQIGKHGNDSKDPELLKALARVGDVQDICHVKTFAKRLVEHAGKKWLLNETWLNVDHWAHERREDYKQYSNPKEILKLASQNCSDMVLFCMWRDAIHNCSELFQEVETDYGNCCTFNTIPLTLLLKYANDSRDPPERIKGWARVNLSADNLLNQTRGSKYPFRQSYPGTRGGLTVLLDPKVHEYSCTSTDSEGFAVGINGPLDYPRMKDNGILLGTGSEVFVSVRPEVTISDPDVKEFMMEKRYCYFSDEKSLPHYSKYTVSNCLNECLAVKTMEKCDCVRLDMPRAPNDTLCNPDQYNCTEAVQRTIIKQGLSDGCQACYPPCTDVAYTPEVRSLSIREEYLKTIFDTYPERNITKLQNISIVHVYIGVDSTYPRLRKQVYGLIDLISNTGGLLGLCMGFSMLSLVEIVYHCSLRLAFRRRRNCLEDWKGSKNCENEKECGSGQHQNWLFKMMAPSNWSSTTPTMPFDFPNEDAIFNYVRRRKSSAFFGKMSLYYNTPSFQTAFSRGYGTPSIAKRGVPFQ